MSADLPLLLALAPLLGLAGFGLAWRVRRARRLAAAAWDPGALVRLGRVDRLGPVLLGLAALVATLGAAGPRWGSRETTVESRALNLVLAIDISRSMLAEDVAPSRLERALREARRLAQDARGDRLALLAFAGRSYILTPLTLDESAVALQLDALHPDIASEGGSELAAVLTQGREILSAAGEGGARVLVVFTDGEDHGPLDATLAAARSLRSTGVRLVLVAEGDTLPARIPLRDPGGALRSHKTDASGVIVRTMRRDAVLRAVADAADGTLVAAELPDQAGAVWRLVAGLERSAARERRRDDLIPRAWLFALAAAGLLCLQALVRRGGALVAVTLAAGLAFSAEAQRPAEGARRLLRGDTAGASAAFGRRAGDTAHFNAGTAALAAGLEKEAAAWLSAGGKSLDPGLRFRALYNQGLLALRQARREARGRDEQEALAAQRFREALLLAPDSREAKWNLELAQSRRPPPPPSGGGARPPPRPQGGGEPAPPAASGTMSPAEAEQILASVERAEQLVRADQVRRRRVAQSAAGRDW